MSGGEDGNGVPPKKPKRKTAYEVGYGKPPEGTRFRPGKSGNLKGRPKKKLDPDTMLMSRPARAALRDELYRPLKLGDGSQMPALQAVARAAMMTAAKGSAHAQRTVLQFARDMEEAALRERDGKLRLAWKAKERGQDFVDKWLASGRSESDTPIHPDDLIIDEDTGEVRVIGPITLDRSAALQRLVCWRDAEQATVLRGAALEASGENDAFTELGRWMAEKKFDAINNYLPPRFQRVLKGRLRPSAPRPLLIDGQKFEDELCRLFES